jgi:hypothetical protein
MLDGARQYIAEIATAAKAEAERTGTVVPEYEFVQSAAEDMPFLADGSVDMFVSGATRVLIIYTLYSSCLCSPVRTLVQLG